MTKIPAGLDSKVGEGEGGELGASECGGVAEQDGRGVAGTDGCGPVDGSRYLADLGDGERPRAAAGRGAVGAA